MPEADAVRHYADRLHTELAGKVITDWELRWPSWAHTDHRGATTLEVTSVGKHILHRLDDGTTLHTHLRMDGSWKVYRPLEVTRRHLADHRLRAVLGAGNAVALGWSLGMMDVLPTAGESAVIGHLGPAILTESWDADVARTNLMRRPERLIGEALLDQRNLAGIGTIWLAETLFAVRLNPWTPIAELGEDRVREIVTTANRLINASLPFPHSTTTGDPRHPTFVHDRLRRPCRVCRTPVAAGRIADPPYDRIMYVCPTCQQVQVDGRGNPVQGSRR